MMNSHPSNVDAALESEQAVAVVRLPDGGLVEPAAAALSAGGVRAIEVTLTVPGALAAIERLAASRDDLLVGVGSVLEPEDAASAISAGARFVVSPVFEPSVVEAALGRGAAAVAGALTPTEALAAHRAGASMVKVFPADAVGRGFLKALLAPMPFLRLMPTGGVTCENAGEWLRAGAAAVGVGSDLVDARAAAAGDWAKLTAAARTLRASCEAARRSQGGAR